MNSRALIASMALLLASGLGVGCGGGYSSMTFRSLQYPVAFSPNVKIGDRVYAADKLSDLGEFKIVHEHWSIFFTAVDLTDDADLSVQLNEAIAGRSGAAISGLTLAVEPCDISYAIPLTWLWFFPSCTKVTMTGRVVKPTR